MAKFIVRRVLLMLLTMLIVSVTVFLITEVSPGNVARNVLGIHITPEQEASFLAQTGLDRPLFERYVNWLIGSDWRAAAYVGMPLTRITTPEGFQEWWAVEPDGTLIRWKLQGDDLIAQRRQPDGTITEAKDNTRWQIRDPLQEIARLETLRAELLADTYLTDSDRQAILEPLDQIIRLLHEKKDRIEELAAALEQPEAALEALMDPAASRKRDVFEQAAAEIKGDEILQALAVAQELSRSPGDEYQTAQLRAMARRVAKAVDRIKALDPELAQQMQQTVRSLEGGDPDTARLILNAVSPRLEVLTAGLGALVQALEGNDYEGVITVLQDIASAQKTPLDESQQRVLAVSLKRVAKALKAADAALSKELGRAADSLKGGDVETARQALARAAERFAASSETIVRTRFAGQARVARTFWGVDTQNHVVRWEKGSGKETWVFIVGTGWKAFSGGPVEYIPLQKGLLRGDPGISLRTGRPVADLLFIRLRNSLVLAGIAFVVVMPLSLLLGLVAGLNEGKLLDRILSISGMVFSVTPEFATGIFLILIFALWLRLVPGATVFGEQAPWTRPDMLILPVLTLTLVELGYVLRITRASTVEVMKAAYVRTAFLKGLPYWRIVFKHVMRNALMAPITVIMLHVNWLLGGIVVVEAIFGYPGLGSYLLASALFKDFNAIEAGAMILVAVAVGTQLIADIIYTFLNPRIRYT
ncbi:MAG: ABC transporter permease subunit [Anaerolineae bacterium]|nr:ABC transporter permease subunit [Anaerolineae bacterium]MDW8071420.1 ABC transporter permease subunit [Anaerolineae bacterium]